MVTRGVAQTFDQLLVGMLVLCCCGMLEGRGVDHYANCELAWVCSSWLVLTARNCGEGGWGRLNWCNALRLIPKRLLSLPSSRA